MRGRGLRDFRYPDALEQPDCGTVVPRLVLDQILCRRAVEAGAELWEDTVASHLLFDGQTVVGVEVTRDRETIPLRAPVVIACDGATSRLGYQARLVATPTDRLGYAIRGYYAGVEELGDLLEIYMPLLDATDRYLLPSYGWVFATGAGTANIGVGLVRRERGVRIRELFVRFLDTLRREPRFRAIEPCGEWRGAALRFDFHPERCAAPGLLLVGDAAGMISPFTGEGIGYALESGRIAAQTVHDALSGASGAHLDLSAYPAALGRRFTGYFEAGRASARRYQLLWHVLESTFQSERPLFDVCRRAALFPEGIGESYIDRAFDDVTPYLADASAGDQDGASDPALLRADLLAIGDVLLDTVRRDWPFLSKLLTAEQTVPGLPFRPALLLLLAGRIAKCHRSLLVSVGAAVELGYLAAFAQASVCDEPNNSDHCGADRANWGNKFAVIVSDFLLSKAYAMNAQLAQMVSREISASLATACEGHVLAIRNAYNPDLTPNGHLAIVEKKAASLFSLPCRLGAMLSGATPRAIAALSGYGRDLGLAYLLVDEALAWSGTTSELGRATGPDVREGIYGFALLHVLQSKHREQVRQELAAMRRGEDRSDALYEILQSQGGIEACLAEARTRADRARNALCEVPHGSTRKSLLGLSHYAVERIRGDSSRSSTVAPEAARDPRTRDRS